MWGGCFLYSAEIMPPWERELSFHQECHHLPDEAHYITWLKDDFIAREAQDYAKNAVHVSWMARLTRSITAMPSGSHDYLTTSMRKLFVIN